MKESPAKLFRKAPTLLHLFNHQNEDAGERHHNDCRREHQSVRAGSYHNGGGDNRADHLTESSGNVQNAQILPGLFFIRQNVNIERLIDGTVHAVAEATDGGEENHAQRVVHEPWQSITDGEQHACGHNRNLTATDFVGNRTCGKPEIRETTISTKLMVEMVAAESSTL